ncbi:hypothetical protein [Thalassobacillus sp. C254]|uniref:hypothetical protein n=1 Tax=Thalassobacillus sp. C254 TaxID=1225341 RepID=UPI0006D08268|nr:hypothetical protein [Thalassobacillus sp. C254]
MFTKNYPNLNYKEVILGFEFENNHSRWLTQKEICDGVIWAYNNKGSRFIIGKTEPWSLKP